jgi:hypothetical protein
MKSHLTVGACVGLNRRQLHYLRKVVGDDKVLARLPFDTPITELDAVRVGTTVRAACFQPSRLGGSGGMDYKG